MDRKKTQQIGIVLPIMLALSFIMLIIYLLFGVLDRQLNYTYNETVSDKDNGSSSYSALSGDNSQNFVRHDVSCYFSVIQQQLAEFGEPRIMKVSNAPGSISAVYNPNLYYMDGAYIELFDMDGDGIQELFCAGINHDESRISAKLFSFTQNTVYMLTDDLPMMYLPEDNVQSYFVCNSANSSCYLLQEQYNPDGKPIVLMQFYQKTGMEMNSAGKYVRGKKKDISKFDDYIRVEGISAIPLSLETDSRTGDLVTAVGFPPIGSTEDTIMEYVQASADTISRILQ